MTVGNAMVTELEHPNAHIKSPIPKDNTRNSLERSKQERYGLIPLNKKFLFPRCLVVAFCWPSILWSLNLMSNGIKFMLYMCDISDSEQEEITACYPSVTILSLQECKRYISMSDTFLIGQGDVTQLWRFWLMVGRTNLVHTILFCSFNRMKQNQFCGFNVKWTRFKHKKLGGLTNSQFLIGISADVWKEELYASISNLDLVRTLMDIIDQGQIGSPVEKPNLGSLDIWDVKNDSSFSIYPSYRSSTGWVERSLTFSEKALCLDMNELTTTHIQSSSMNCVMSLIESGNLYPGKLGQVVASWMMSLWSVNIKNQLNDSKEVGLDHVKNEVRSPGADDAYLKFEQDYLESYGQKAAKNDNDAVPVELWDRAILRDKFTWLEYSPKVKAALKIIRNEIAFKWYLRMLRRSLFNYLRLTYGKNWWELLLLKNRTSRKRKFEEFKIGNLQKDLLVSADALTRAARSSWWEWRDGSTCFFWRWPKEIRKFVRDGYPVHVETALPVYRQRQVFHLKEKEMNQLSKKINKVLDRRYLETGYVHSLINYFAVPKGKDDIRIVYDGTKCGLNDCVWAPNFFLPSVDSLLMYTSTSTWFADLDLGEMFLNYFIDSKLRPYCGVDISKLAQVDEVNHKWVRWNRTLMGFRSSPYIACKLFGWTLDVVKGDRLDVENPFRWNRININLPGSDGYNPTKPWIAKQWNDQEASDSKAYMDDGRTHGSNERITRKATRRVASITQYLGQQNADRKSRPPSKKPGPWCGAFLTVQDDSVYVYVSQEKWEKAKSYVKSWLVQIKKDPKNSTLDFKNLERGRGFLVYLSRTYPATTPFLKGIHLTLDSWRDGRDSDGWKLSKKKRKLNEAIISEPDEFEDSYFGKGEDDEVHETTLNGNKPPKNVYPVTRLLQDLEVLNDFFAPEEPPYRFVRGGKVTLVKYGFGDASKSGFGSTIQTQDGIAFRYGTWSTSVQEESSNFRELENLAESLEMEGNLDKLQGCEVFLLTDNSTAELAFFKGTSSSPKLLEIIIRLRRLEMHCGCKINFIHVAGSRMIAQGTDGLSRGDLGEGVMKGSSMLSFVPLHLSSLTRSDQLLNWSKSWIEPSLRKQENLEVLSEADWFWRAHDIVGGSVNADGIWIPKFKSGIFLWVPPPAAGQFAIEELRAARNKRTESLHIFLIPRLFTPLWKRQLARISDLLFELPFVEGVWEKHTQHEPLTLAFVFPFLRHSPWRLRRANTFLELGRILPRLWKEGKIPPGTLLCKLLSFARNLETMPQDMVCRMLRSARSCGFLYSEATE